MKIGELSFFSYLFGMPQKIEIFDEGKQCSKCGVFRQLDEYYKRKHKNGKEYYNATCIECCKNARAEYHLGYNWKKIVEYQNKWIIHNKPGHFANQKQKQELIEFMTTKLKWNYNEEKNLFWKPGLKNADGTWVNIIDIPKPRKMKWTPEIKAQIVKEYKQGNITQSELREKYGINPFTLRNILKGIFNEIKERRIYDKKGNIIGFR